MAVEVLPDQRLVGHHVGGHEHDERVPEEVRFTLDLERPAHAARDDGQVVRGIAALS